MSQNGSGLRGEKGEVMTHELTMDEAGRAEMAFVGATPWHGLGQRLEPGASIEQWQEAAGMGWEIKRVACSYLPEGATEYLQNEEKHMLYRSDNHKPLAVMSQLYNIVQPGEVLEFFRDLCEHLGFTIETAGTMFDGKRYWALANIGPEVKVLDPKDTVRGRLLVTTSCDGTTATIGKFVMERVVCANTMAVALNERGGTVIRVRHARKFDADQVKSDLGFDLKELGPKMQDKFTDQMKEIRKLAKARMTDADVVKATLEAFAPGAWEFPVEKVMRTLHTKEVRKVATLAIGNDPNYALIGSDMDGMKGTAWRYVNAMTQYGDWDNGSRSPDRRLERAWLGRYGDHKINAYEIAVEHAKGNKLAQHTYPLSDEELVAEALRPVKGR